MPTSLKSKFSSIILSVFLVLLFSCSYGCLNSINPFSHKTENQVVIYFCDENLIFLVPITYSIKEKQPTPRLALDLLINTKSPDKHLLNLFPEGCSLLNFEIKNGIACLSFSKDFRKAFDAGGLEGNMLVSSIKYTLSNFNEIKGIMLFVEGKSVETLGELDLSGKLEMENWKNLFLTGKESRVPGEKNRAIVYLLLPETQFLVPITYVFDDDNKLPQEVISLLARGLDEGWAKPVLPSGTEVVSFRKENGIAYIDFNSAFLNVKDGLPPEIILNSLALSLTEFGDIKELEITIEGKKLKKYGTFQVPSRLLRPKSVNLLEQNVASEFY